MTKIYGAKGTIIAIDPFTRGFGYVVFQEGRLLDWGLREAKTNKNATCVEKFDELADLYNPHVVVLENTKDKTSKRGLRVRRLIKAIATRAEKKRVSVSYVSMDEVREHFARYNAHTKYDIAETLAGLFVEFVPRLPPPRKLWMSEDPRMAIFDAAALVLTYIGTYEETGNIWTGEV